MDEHSAELSTMEASVSTLVPEARRGRRRPLPDFRIVPRRRVESLVLGGGGGGGAAASILLYYGRRPVQVDLVVCRIEINSEALWVGSGLLVCLLACLLACLSVSRCNCMLLPNQSAGAAWLLLLSSGYYY